MRAIIWARVSTDEQTTENQLPELRARAAADGAKVVHEYEVIASAYHGKHQSQLKDLQRRARHHEFDVLYVWAVDRIDRQGVHHTFAAVNPLVENGVRVVFVRDHIDTEDAHSPQEILLAITAWQAKQESKRRSERTRAGLERARAEGKILGRPKGIKDKRKRKSRQEADWRRRAGID